MLTLRRTLPAPRLMRTAMRFGVDAGKQAHLVSRKGCWAKANASVHVDDSTDTGSGSYYRTPEHHKSQKHPWGPSLRLLCLCSSLALTLLRQLESHHTQMSADMSSLWKLDRTYCCRHPILH